MSEAEVTLAKKVHIYSNGDRFFTGRRFVINPRQTRNYESFLTQVTHSLKPAFGAVRVLRTPENGHAVGDLGDLETGRSYVACAQKFVKLGYEDITTKPKPAPSPERRNKVVVSGRIRKIERTPISIFVYANGQHLEQAKRILLKPWVNKTWETVLVAISEKINLVTGAVRQIYDFATKEEITEGVHLKHNEYYIAVGSERFKDIEYGMQATVLSPRQQQKRRYPVLRPVKKKSKYEDSQGSSPLESSTTSTQSISKKNDEAPARNRKKAGQAVTNTEEGIPIKPIKHKRGGSDKTKEPGEPKEKPAEKKNPPPVQKTQSTSKKPANKQPVDLDKDEGGVFKAKGKKQKANEVKEDKNTREEVPIDKRKAETVEDEQPIPARDKKEPLPPVNKNKNKSESQKKPPAKKQPAQQQPSNTSNKPDKSTENKSSESEKEQHEAATKIQASYRGHQTRKELKKKTVIADSKEKSTVSKMSKDEAAVKIQANYRGYKVRKNLKNQKQENTQRKDVSANEPDEEAKRNAAAVKIQANYRGYKVRKDMKKREAAATTIQAGYRGYRARKEVKALREQRIQQEGDTEARAQSSQAKNNADQENAAIKIQARFRGYSTRKHLTNKG
ncbi:doublecortin domain-containing protein 2-like isoform X2 [Watersipora subatra]|uniref:doublecortin domain-containing protein 2-like isoform X2 n=1 Tax=Watersipora subatra TaxID=2589382 RepID=UPI00355C3F12